MARPRASRIILLFMFLFILGVAAMNAWQVYQAREYTEKELAPQMAAGRWALTGKDLTLEQIAALIAVEDPAFFQHQGIDYSTPGAGLTTISQAVAKKVYFTRFEPGIEPISQVLYAYFALDPVIKKLDQLTLYINQVDLGPGIQGFEQAARHYFKLPFAELDEDQYLGLIAMIASPKAFDLKKYPQRNRERVARIKKRISGEYQPKELLDVYYGPLDQDTQRDLEPFTYFDFVYKD